MIKRFIEKYMCMHKWINHAHTMDYRANSNTEVLICEKCGKIIKINY